VTAQKPDLKRLAAEERASLLELLRQLSPHQWATRSLCPAWTVRQVATHVVSYDDLSWAGLGFVFLRGGFRVSSVNEVALRRYVGRTDADIVALVASHVEPRGLSAGLGGGIALTDGTIHHQDIRRALGLPRSIPEERLRSVLNFALTAPTIPAKANAKGLRVKADDLDWVHGDGLAVTGPGEALLMTLAGRAAALPELDGPGLPTLAARVHA
jgi:uncharacterized protein (TIGR03083 family)